MNVEDVSVQSPVGTVPRLPYRLWVTYSDGRGEYRQVKWEISSVGQEEKLSNASENPKKEE